MPDPKKNFFKKHWFPITALTLGLLLAGYFYIKSQRAESRAAKKMEQFEETLVNRFSNMRTELDTKVLGLMGETFTWAVRRSLMRGYMDEIEDYIYDLIQNEDVLEVHILNDKEIIIASSDIGLIESQFKKVPGQELPLNHVSCVLQDSFYLVTAPINTLDNHLGHTIIRYKAQKLE